MSQSNLKKKLTTDQCSELKVLYQESSVNIEEDRNVASFQNWGEEFVISLDFEAWDFPPGVTNILHIYDYGLYDFGAEPEGYGWRIPGCRTFQPCTFQPDASNPIFSILDFSTVNASTMTGSTKE